MDEDLVSADLIRLEKVDVLVNLISIDANVEIRVWVFIEWPSINLDDARIIHSKEKVTIVTSLAPEVDWLLVLELYRLSYFDQFGHLRSKLGLIK